MLIVNPAPTSHNTTELHDYFKTANGQVIATKKGDDRITRIYSADAKTFKGIGVGQFREEVVSLYGTDYYKRTEQGATIIGYVDKDLRHTLEFWMFEDVVVNIRLDIGEMN